MIRPTKDRILVKLLEQKETTNSGIIIGAPEKKPFQEGIVVNVGTGTEIQKGDHIYFGKYAGSEIGKESYLIIKEDEVLGVFVEER